LHAFQKQKQSKPFPNPKFYIVQKNVFFIEILCNIAKNRSTKGTPLQALALAIKKLELALAIKKHISGSSSV